jgi:hypothetical protein
MLDCGHDLSPCCDVRAELVGDDALGRDALLIQQASQETSGGFAVAPGLQNFVENIALLIDRALEPMFLSSDADQDLIEMPDVAAAGLLALEAADKPCLVLNTALEPLIGHGPRHQIFHIAVLAPANSSR